MSGPATARHPGPRRREARDGHRVRSPTLLDVLSYTDIDRALVVTAHPDDVDFGAAGTVATMVAAGVDVTYCLVTDGQAGGYDETIDRREMAAIRRAEQTEAAAVVGVTDLVFLGHPDGAVEYSLDLRHEIARVIRRTRPRVVISQSPHVDLASTYASHPDHVATGQAVFAAVYPDARNPFAFPELVTSGLDPWSVDELWVMGHPDSTAFVDISAHLDRKIEALRCHRSQHRDPGAMEERVREWNRSNAVRGGLPDGAAAEVFLVVDTR